MKSILIAIIGLSLLSIILFSSTTLAHSPVSMNLSYNQTNQNLNVTITHNVADTTTHHINKITLTINNGKTTQYNYTSQPTTNTFTYSYQLAASPNDTIKITALCNQAGSITKELTITESGTTTNTDGTSTPGFEIILLFGAILTIVFLNKKYHK